MPMTYDAICIMKGISSSTFLWDQYLPLQPMISPAMLALAEKGGRSAWTHRLYRAPTSGRRSSTSSRLLE